MTPKHALAAILVESNKELVVDEIKLPPDLRFGQVLVELHWSGVCGAQINEIQAVKGPDKFLPHLLGHEGYATVLDIGEGVTSVQLGDKVVMHWRPGSGLQAAPAKYEWRGEPLNSGWVTTFNTHAVVSENRVTSIDPAFDPRVAPMLGCALTTAFGVLANDARVRVGESVVILGAGGVGLALVQAATLMSTYPVIAVDIFDAKLAAAADLGASHTILSGDDVDLNREILAVVGSVGADVVIETTGIPALIEAAYEMAAPHGRVVCVGVPPRDGKVRIYTLPLHFDKVLTGSHGGDSHPEYDIPRLARLALNRRAEFDRIPVAVSTLEGINDALESLRSGTPGRQLIRF